MYVRCHVCMYMDCVHTCIPHGVTFLRRIFPPSLPPSTSLPPSPSLPPSLLPFLPPSLPPSLPPALSLPPLQTTKVRQRFVVKPHTAHIVCMKAVPGSVEESSEFTDSALMGMDTSWVEEAFSSSRKTHNLELHP